MKTKILADKISKIAGAQVRLNEPMSSHTSLKIGGSADIFVSPRGIDSLQQVISLATADNIKYHVIGNGTNLLVSDDGVRGIVIQIKEGFNRIIRKMRREEAVIKVEAGVPLGKILKLAKDEGLSGFEFAAGIPGSIGGAVCMNASTKLGAVSDVLHSIEVFSGGKLQKFKKDELDFRYRELNIDSKTIILNAVFCMNFGNKVKIAETIDKFIEERRNAQPKGKSAGCIFKNPENRSAGKIIDELGFKGQKIGGAYVSDVHANFIMNDGTATCADFIALIRKIRKDVEEKSGIKLEYEIKFLGNM